VLEDLSEERAIVFTKFERMANIIYKEIGEDKCFLITGDTKNKINAIEEFKNSSKQFLIATDCLNYGVNLEFLKTLIHFDLAWTPAKMEQREGRIDRLTQEQKMLVIKLITKNTFEESVVKILERKQTYINDAIHGGDYGITDKEIIENIVKNNNT
jgi:SNF2 family DNA or RNA helicase